MDKLLYVIALIALGMMISFSSCRCTKEIYTERVDTIYTIKGDTNYIYYQIECDSLNQPVLTTQEEGDNSKIDFTTRLSSSSNKLDIRTTAKVENTRVPITKWRVKEVIKEAEIPSYYRNISWCFWILLGLNILIIVFKLIIKFYLK